jgi:hypothetical protein
MSHRVLANSILLSVAPFTRYDVGRPKHQTGASEMNSDPSRRLICRGLILSGVIGLIGLFALSPAGAQDSPAPVRMDPNKMAGLDLMPIPNDGFIDILVEGEFEFTPGDAFVVPKGYTGTWEQHGRYRELAVIAKSGE